MDIIKFDLKPEAEIISVDEPIISRIVPAIIEPVYTVDYQCLCGHEMTVTACKPEVDVKCNRCEVVCTITMNRDS